MISRTLLITSITGLCMIGAGTTIKPKQTTWQSPPVAHTGQDPVNRILGAAPLSTERVASGLSRPVQVAAAPGDTERLFIVEQRSGSTGRIKILNLCHWFGKCDTVFKSHCKHEFRARLAWFSIPPKLQPKRLLLCELHREQWRHRN